LVKAIAKARKSVEIVIFRFDEVELERALIEAAERGVFVHALIAFTNRGGERGLRRLEMKLLEKGITVARTADDLVRYHGKMVLIDRKELFLLAFNFTHLDIERSRSFGLATRNAKLVQEASRLFEADTKRQEYKAGSSRFLVSPVNARKELTAFIKGARRQLLIYDLKLSDGSMLRALHDRIDAGVELRIIGSAGRKANGFQVRKLKRMRLHTRTILRDGRDAFVGSQSLRQLELDARREIGMIFREKKAVATLVRTFEEDWQSSAVARSRQKRERRMPMKKAVKHAAKAITKKIPVDPVIEKVVRVVRKQTDLDIDHKDMEETVKGAVKDAVKVAVKDAAKKMMRGVVEHAVEAS
jgi:phosphatidylserine/phosphatidylglycerophosphate/cardiolipin synthase-like enzyme